MGSTSVQAPFIAVRRGSPELRRPLLFLTFDSSRTIRSVRCSALVSKPETGKNSSSKKKSFAKKQAKRVKAVAPDTSVSLPDLNYDDVAVKHAELDASSSSDLNYDEVAEKLESIFKSSSAETEVLERENEEREDQIGELDLGGMRLVRGNRRKMRRLACGTKSMFRRAPSS